MPFQLCGVEFSTSTGVFLFLFFKLTVFVFFLFLLLCCYARGCLTASSNNSSLQHPCVHHVEKKRFINSNQLGPKPYGN